MCSPLPPFPSPLWAPRSENNGPVWDWNVSGGFAKQDTLNFLGKEYQGAVTLNDLRPMWPDPNTEVILAQTTCSGS